jgi:hypothetical protein
MGCDLALGPGFVSHMGTVVTTVVEDMDERIGLGVKDGLVLYMGDTSVAASASTLAGHVLPVRTVPSPAVGGLTDRISNDAGASVILLQEPGDMQDPVPPCLDDPPCLTGHLLASVMDTHHQAYQRVLPD